MIVPPGPLLAAVSQTVRGESRMPASRRARSARRFRQQASTMVELLLALPAVMVLGLGIAQFTLVYQAKHALDYALTQAARQGAVGHASPESIRQGLANGLVPYLYGANDWAGLLAAEARALDHVAQGAALGWIELRQRSPSQESFEDWAEPAVDTMGEPVPGMVEIPNDNLDNRRLRTQPQSGVAGIHQSEPIGRLSNQTLADANLLRLELVYGVRLAVPVVGSLIIRTLSLWNGCSGATPAAQAGDSAAARGERFGLLLLGSSGTLAASQSWMCPYYGALDSDGRAVGRIPIRLSATVRMMSTARRSDMTQHREATASALPSLGAGQFDSLANESLPGQHNDGSGSASSTRGRGDRGSDPSLQAVSVRRGLENGFLNIGTDRPYPVPQGHPALCQV